MSVDELAQQHLLLLQEIHDLWVALIVLVALGLIAMFSVVALAAWSVQKVNRRVETEMSMIVQMLKTWREAVSGGQPQ